MLEDNKEKIKVGVLRGGVGPYYQTSLQEGGNIIAHIVKNLSDKYKPVDILIDTDGIWHINGLPLKSDDVLKDKVDIVWNTSHPNLSQLFKDLSVPLVGTNSFNFSSKDSKDILREHMKEIKVKMPRHLILPLYQKDIDVSKENYALQKAKDVFEKFSSPWLVKALNPDISMGVHVTNTFLELADAILDGIEHGHGILVEELITGKQASIHSMAGFRDKEIYSFPPSNFTSSNSFSSTEKEKLVTLAEEIYKHISAESYLKLDFIFNPTKGIYLKDVSFSPSLSEDSHFNQSCESVGAKMHHAIEYILEASLADSI